MPDIQVRSATPADIPRMTALINQAFAIETFLDGTRTDEEQIREMMRTGEFLLAEEQGQLLASVYVERRGHRGYFGMLAVHSAAQGSGLGRKMVAAAEEHCRHLRCTHMDITVLSLRPDLPPFYRKLGYRETGREPFQTRRNIQAGLECECIVMSRELTVPLRDQV